MDAGDEGDVAVFLAGDVHPLRPLEHRGVAVRPGDGGVDERALRQHLSPRQRYILPRQPVADLQGGLHAQELFNRGVDMARFVLQQAVLVCLGQLREGRGANTDAAVT